MNPCSVIDASGGGNVVIDFLAHDPDGHLDRYEPMVTYGENASIDLLALGNSIPVPAPVPPAGTRVGPSYSDALGWGQNATRPPDRWDTSPAPRPPTARRATTP